MHCIKSITSYLLASFLYYFLIRQQRDIFSCRCNVKLTYQCTDNIIKLAPFSRNMRSCVCKNLLIFRKMLLLVSCNLRTGATCGESCDRTL